MAINLTTAPAVEPVSVADAKEQSRIDISDDDSLIAEYLAAARKYAEDALTSSAFITQTWQLTMDAWPGGSTIYLPRAPLQSVTSVKYYDEDDNGSTFASSNYYVDTASKPGRLVLKSDASWPTTELREANGVLITFVAGYGDAAAAVPGPIKAGIRLLFGDLYENRENSFVAQGVTLTELPFGVRMLFQNYDMKSHKVTL